MRYTQRTSSSPEVANWGKPTTSSATIRKVETFTSSGTWTVPTGVTYAIANMIGGGGGCNNNAGGTYGVSGASGGNGGDSSVAYIEVWCIWYRVC